MPLLLVEGHSWATVTAMLFCSSRAIDRWVNRFHAEGIGELAGHKPGCPFRLAADRIAGVVARVTTMTPRDFGFLRSRWCREAVALLMSELHQIEVSSETVRRWLHRGGPVYRRSRPVVGPTNAEREAKPDAPRALPDGETAVLQDEVDINTNAEIGSMWRPGGQQATVRTPGTNRKRHLPGSIHWRTSRVFVAESRPSRAAPRSCSGPTWTSCGADCSATARSTSSATT